MYSVEEQFIFKYEIVALTPNVTDASETFLGTALQSLTLLLGYFWKHLTGSSVSESNIIQYLGGIATVIFTVLR